MRPERKFLKLIMVLVLIDLLTKLLALHTLPYEQDVFLIEDRVTLYLTINRESTGGQAGYFLRQEANKNQILVLNSVATLLMIGFIFFLKKQQIRKLFKWLLFVGY